MLIRFDSDQSTSFCWSRYVPQQGSMLGELVWQDSVLPTPPRQADRLIYVYYRFLFVLYLDLRFSMLAFRVDSTTLDALPRLVGSYCKNDAPTPKALSGEGLQTSWFVLVWLFWNVLSVVIHIISLFATRNVLEYSDSTNPCRGVTHSNNTAKGIKRSLGRNRRSGSSYPYCCEKGWLGRLAK